MAIKLQFVTLQGNALETIVFDATLTESHELDADVTEFPVEEGEDVSDNVRKKLPVLSLDAFISDYPLANEGRTQTSSGGPVDTQRPPAQKERAKNALAAMEKYQGQGTLITVETGLRTYRNMVIRTITPKRDKDTNGGMRFGITLKGIRVTKTSSVAVQRVAEPKGQPKQKDGAKQSTETDEGTKAKKKSLIKKTGQAAIEALQKALGQ